MSPTLNGSSVLQSFGRGNAIKICSGIMFNFYSGTMCVSFHTVGGRDAETGTTVLEADPQRKYTH